MDVKSIVAALIISGIILGVVGAKTYVFIEDDPRFCKTCHLMEEAWYKWNESPHRNVTCHKCHVANMEDNMRLLVVYFTERPEKVREDIREHIKIENEKCEKCHFKQGKWPYVAETAGHKFHLEEAKANCIDCHGGRIHRFIPDRSDCLQCHSDKKLRIKSMDFHCTNCHPFLASVSERGEDIKPHQQDCRKCHSERNVILALPENAHANSDCSNCHQPHVTEEPFSCETCHTVPKNPMHMKHEGKDCESCHQPHSVKGVREVCESCHEDKKDHYPTLKCTTCHK